MARALIIDDDAVLRQSLAKHLEHFGHSVRQARQGDDGIREFKREAADVAVVDIFMPGQGGLQTIGLLRHESPAVKIIAMSGAAAAGGLDVAEHAMAVGADHFLRKPFEAATLVSLISTLLGERQRGAT